MSINSTMRWLDIQAQSQILVPYIFQSLFWICHMGVHRSLISAEKLRIELGKIHLKFEYLRSLPHLHAVHIFPSSRSPAVYLILKVWVIRIDFRIKPMLQLTKELPYSQIFITAYLCTGMMYPTRTRYITKQTRISKYQWPVIVDTTERKEEKETEDKCHFTDRTGTTFMM